MHKTLCNIFRGGGGGCPLAHACGRPCSLLVLSCKAGRFSNLSFEVVVDDVFFSVYQRVMFLSFIFLAIQGSTYYRAISRPQQQYRKQSWICSLPTESHIKF